jgi:hypothetical protein
MTRNSLNGIIGLLQQPQPVNYKDELIKFKDYTLALDEHRNQSLASVDIRLMELLNV